MDFYQKWASRSCYKYSSFETYYSFFVKNQRRFLWAKCAHWIWTAKGAKQKLFRKKAPPSMGPVGAWGNKVLQGRSHIALADGETKHSLHNQYRFSLNLHIRRVSQYNQIDWKGTSYWQKVRSRDSIIRSHLTPSSTKSMFEVWLDTFVELELQMIQLVSILQIKTM